MKSFRLLIACLIVAAIFAQPVFAVRSMTLFVDFLCSIDYEGNGTITHMNGNGPMPFRGSPTSLLDLNIMEATDLRMQVAGSFSAFVTLSIGLRGPTGTTLASYQLDPFTPQSSLVLLEQTPSGRVFALSPTAAEMLQSDIDHYRADKLFLAMRLSVSGFSSGAIVNVFSARTEIDVDIKPGERPNTINPRNRGVIPVAIVTTAEFDATTVDVTTLRFGTTGNEASPVHIVLDDVNGDGKVDLVLHFRTQQTAIECEASMALLKGSTITGQVLGGRDALATVGCK